MDQVILAMLKQYNCVSSQDYENALKEIIQEIALVGLWRAKFFEHAAFYGGTALRILYGLNRFSEDLDFSLLQQNLTFELAPYLNAIQTELTHFGFETEVEIKQKQQATAVQSAFVKANTQQHLLRIQAPSAIQAVTHAKQLLKVKLEVDTDPPPDFKTESIPQLRPIPFWIKSYCLPDLFAGKLSAVLCRSWSNRVKGRDWYDFLWFVQNNTPVNLKHLEARLIQFGYPIPERPLTADSLKSMLHDKVDALDIALAKQDIEKFIPNPEDLEAWSNALFHKVVEEVLTTR